MSSKTIEYLIIAGIFLAFTSGGYFWLLSWANDRCEQKIEEARAKHQEIIDNAEARYQSLVNELENRNAEAPREIVRYIRNHGDSQCLDASGLQLLERYRKSPSKPAGSVP